MFDRAPGAVYLECIEAMGFNKYENGRQNMLQIIGYLGCVYLVFKGVEIFLAASESDDETVRNAAVWALVAAIGAAIGFAIWLNSQASSMPRL